MDLNKLLTEKDLSVILRPESAIGGDTFSLLVRLPGGSTGSRVSVEVFHRFGVAVEGADVLRSTVSEFPCIPGVFCAGPALPVHPDLVVMLRVSVSAGHLEAGQVAQYRFGEA